MIVKTMTYSLIQRHWGGCIKNCNKLLKTELSYPYRVFIETSNLNLFKISDNIENLGNFSIIWENIGDPVAAGEHVPDWMHNVVQEQVATDKSFAYTETRGAIAARETESL